MPMAFFGQGWDRTVLILEKGKVIRLITILTSTLCFSCFHVLLDFGLELQ